MDPLVKASKNSYLLPSKSKSVLVVVFLIFFSAIFSLFLVGCGDDESEEKVSKQEDENKAPVDEEGRYRFGTDTTETFVDDVELEVDEESDFGTQSKTLTPESPQLSHQGVSIKANSPFEESQIEVDLKKMKAPRPMEDATINAYSFEADTRDYPGTFTIKIPYDVPDDDEAENKETIIGAGYFDEASGKWEPVVYEVDDANNQVIITTDHLSTYCSLNIIGEDTRYARIRSSLFIEARDHVRSLDTHDHGQIVDELISTDGITPGGKAFDLGHSILSSWLDVSGDMLTFEGIFYESKYLSDLSETLGNVGTSLALARLVVDYSRGDEEAMAVNAFNTSRSLAISRWGTKALKVSMVGVSVIDYSINRLADELIDGREDVYEEAYRMYYEENHPRSGKDWYNIIKDIHDNAGSPDEFRNMIDRELDTFTGKFWEDESEVMFYQQEVMGHAFTGAGGISEEVRREISSVYKSELLKERFSPAFRSLEIEVEREQIEDYQTELQRLRDELNKVVTMDILEEVKEDEEPKYAGYIVQIGPLAEDEDPSNWTGVMGEDGIIETGFSVLSYLAAKAPNEIRLYETNEDLEKDNPEKVVSFKVDVPETTVIISEEEGELCGFWEGDMVITDSILAEEEFQELELDTAAEGCEEEFDKETIQAINQMIAEIMKALVGTDIPIDVEIEKEEDIQGSEVEGYYEAIMHIYINQALATAMPELADELDFGEYDTQYLSGNFEDGELLLILEDDDNYETKFTASFQGEDILAGEFFVISREPESMGENIMKGTWEVERVDEEEK